MAGQFEKKVVVLTGAGSGIGRATSIKMASLGATLALSDINTVSLLATQALCANPTKHMTHAFDVGSTDETNNFVLAVMAQFGRIDRIFNCAGINPKRLDTESISDDYWNTLVNTNLKGLFNVTRACIPHLESGAAFVNVSSIAGIRPTAGMAVYCATKYAVIGFSKCIALELGPKGIRTNVVAPGAINTPTNASVVAGPETVEKIVKGVALGRMGTAEEVADTVVFLFGDESRYMNGSVVEINGGAGH